MQFYETASDYYSLVRILCFNGQTSRAAEVVEESGCRAAAYHLARRLSVENEVNKNSYVEGGPHPFVVDFAVCSSKCTLGYP